MQDNKFRIALTPDIRKANGDFTFPLVDFEPLVSDDRVEITILPEESTINAEALRGHDVLVLLGGFFTAQSIPDDDRLAAILRFGAGFDKVSVDDLTAQGIVLCNTPGGMQRPVAVAALSLLLALSTRLAKLDRLARTGSEGWHSAVYDSYGTGLVGRTLGVLGAGRIGQDFIHLCKPLGMKVLVHDPYLNEQDCRSLDVESVSLEDLFLHSDFLSVNCPLNDTTKGIVSRERIAQMKPEAFLINTSRGPVVDQQALVEALEENRIAGAGLDVLQTEPAPIDDPVFKLDNVIVTAHSLCVTDQCYENIGNEITENLQSIMSGSMPINIINRDVTDNIKRQDRFDALRHKFNGSQANSE